MNAGAGPFVHASTAFVASVAADAVCFAIMAVYVCGSIGSHHLAIRTGKTSADGKNDGTAQHITCSGKTSTSDGRGPTDGPLVVARVLASGVTVDMTFVVAVAAHADNADCTEATASHAVSAVRDAAT